MVKRIDITDVMMHYLLCFILICSESSLRAFKTSLYLSCVSPFSLFELAEDNFSLAGVFVDRGLKHQRDNATKAASIKMIASISEKIKSVYYSESDERSVEFATTNKVYQSLNTMDSSFR
jgi:hypothetical protein